MHFFVIESRKSLLKHFEICLVDSIMMKFRRSYIEKYIYKLFTSTCIYDHDFACKKLKNTPTTSGLPCLPWVSVRVINKVTTDDVLRRSSQCQGQQAHEPGKHDDVLWCLKLLQRCSEHGVDTRLRDVIRCCLDLEYR